MFHFLIERLAEKGKEGNGSDKDFKVLMDFRKRIKGEMGRTRY